MPELPEVETVVRFLNGKISGELVTQAIFYREKNITCGIQYFATNIIGATILKVSRTGKYLLFELSNGKVFLAHLRMEGKFFVYEPGEAIESKHDILRLSLQSGKTLVYNDTRKFGTLGLYPNERLYVDSPLASLAPDPFLTTSEKLYGKIRQFNKPIKELLMDQTIISGIGNIYADEILFASFVNPRTPGKEISFRQCEIMITEAQKIMSGAISLGGSTIRSYHPALGMDGKMQNSLLAYHNVGECPRCLKPMRRIFMNARSTHFCPSCQKDPERPITICITGPIHSGKSSVTKYIEGKGIPTFNSDNVAKSLYFDRNIQLEIEAIIGKKIIKKGILQIDTIRKAYLQKRTKEKAIAILYPALREKAKDFITENNEQRFVVFEIPLYHGSGLEDLIDYLLYVDAPFELRKARLESEGKDAEVMMSLNRGYPETLTKKEANYILFNDSDITSLFAQVDKLKIFE